MRPTIEAATVHVPILVQPIVDALVEPFRKIQEPHMLVDCTLGGGGHTAVLLNALQGTPHRILGVDQDQQALERAAERFHAEIAEGRLELEHARFGELDLSSRPVLGLMADLGFSSDQLEDPLRGLSFQSDGPLDMRLDPSQGRTCRDYLLQVSEKELAEVIHEYGEERFSRRIAGAIVGARREKRLPKTTLELTDLIVRSLPPPARHGRIHAATRTFQALRIVVNNELNQLDWLLGRVMLSIKPGGRVAILSFHSLEDRKVKLAFKSDAFRALTKKPIEADEEEVRRNPRARSAKLRIGERAAL